MEKDYLSIKKVIKNLKTLGTCSCPAAAHMFRWTLWTLHHSLIPSSRKKYNIFQKLYLLIWLGCIRLCMQTLESFFNEDDREVYRLAKFLTPIEVKFFLILFEVMYISLRYT